MRLGALLGALLGLLITCSCGNPSTRATPNPPVAEIVMRVLATSAVPGVPSTTTVLSVPELAKDASIPGLTSMLTSWGYLDGRERIFQGQSRHLTLVVSRSLIFKDATGARAFVAFVQANAWAFFGGVVEKQPLVAQGRSGWLFTPPMCACHMANPVIVGVLNDGSGVVWLEINGPEATPALLVSLLDPTLSVPATLVD